MKHIRYRSLLSTLSAIVLCLSLSVEVEANDALIITNAWSPEAPPGRTMAGFMTIENATTESIQLVDGYSPQFGRIEIHDMIQTDGVMRMRHLDALSVPASSTVILKPGGFHVMLFEPQQRLAVGDTIDLVLIDDRQQRHQALLTVRAR